MVYNKRVYENIDAFFVWLDICYFFDLQSWFLLKKEHIVQKYCIHKNTIKQIVQKMAKNLYRYFDDKTKILLYNCRGLYIRIYHDVGVKRSKVSFGRLN